MRGPQESSLADESIDHFSAEFKDKVASKRLHLLLYDEIRVDTPKQMKVSPIYAILLKSKAFKSTLDLSF